MAIRDKWLVVEGGRCVHSYPAAGTESERGTGAQHLRYLTAPVTEGG
jgi:hypothetical protein